MIHVHKTECESTQDLAVKLSKEYEQDDILVSCEMQLYGEGQRGKEWFSTDQSLAISFSTWASDIFALSSLEMAVLTRQFIEETFNVQTKLKWPNDIFTKDRKKCAGILIQSSNEKLIVGIGVNLFQKEKPSHLNQLGSLFSEQQNIDNEKISRKLRDYITKNRMPSNIIAQQWERHCLHLNQEVKVLETDCSYRGTFKGVGEQGQALVELDGKTVELFSASLIIDPL